MRTRMLMLVLGGAFAIGVAILAATLSLGGSSQADVSSVAERANAAKVAKSAALAKGETIGSQVNRERRDEAALRIATARVSARIPLPDGGNFNGIRFDDLAGMGGLADDALEQLLQANAACQWYAAYAAGRELETAKAIIPQIADWNGLRNDDDIWSKPTRDFLAGGSGGAFEQMTATCEETRADQRRYALERNLEPTI